MADIHSAYYTFLYTYIFPFCALPQKRKPSKKKKMRIQTDISRRHSNLGRITSKHTLHTANTKTNSTHGTHCWRPKSFQIVSVIRYAKQWSGFGNIAEKRSFTFRYKHICSFWCSRQSVIRTTIFRSINLFMNETVYMYLMFVCLRRDRNGLSWIVGIRRTSNHFRIQNTDVDSISNGLAKHKHTADVSPQASISTSNIYRIAKLTVLYYCTTRSQYGACAASARFQPAIMLCELILKSAVSYSVWANSSWCINVVL